MLLGYFAPFFSEFLIRNVIANINPFLKTDCSESFSLIVI